MSMLRPRRERIESAVLRQSIRGLPCFLGVPGACFAGANNERCVPCHAPSEDKGGARKSDDVFVVSGCHGCHDVLDRRTNYPYTNEKISDEQAAWFWLRGIQRQVRYWLDHDLLSIKGVA